MPTPKESPTPMPTAAPPGSILYVGNTGGMGVFIRRTPDVADKLRVWPEGTPMIVVGKARQIEGRLWEHVRDPDGIEGWIPGEYLVGDASPAPAASSSH